jgi:hypothetical protein
MQYSHAAGERQDGHNKQQQQQQQQQRSPRTHGIEVCADARSGRTPI